MRAAIDGQHVYWATQGGKGSIARADIDGANVDGSFIPNQFGPCLVAVDSSYLYWSTGVKRASLDGTGVQYIAPDGSGCGVAVDGKHIYWVNHPGGQGNPDAIGQSNFDGTQAHIFVHGAGDVCGLAVDDRSSIGWIAPGAISTGQVSVAKDIPNWASSGPARPMGPVASRSITRGRAPPGSIWARRA